MERTTQREALTPPAERGRGEDEMADGNTLSGFINRVRSLYNIDHHLLPELSDRDWKEFQGNPARYFINSADRVQADAIWREIEKRQTP